MSQLSPITNPGWRQRAPSVYDLEVTLVKFLVRLFDSSRLDNPTVNQAQPADVSFDPTQRAQSLVAKVPPAIVRGRIPRDVTGMVDVNRLPDTPNIIVQAASGKVMTAETHVTLLLMFTAYDENPNGSGYQDVLIMMEAAAIALAGFGQAALDDAYPLILPLEWKMAEDYFPHFIGEMSTMWQFASASPRVQDDGFVIPTEHVEFRVTS